MKFKRRLKIEEGLRPLLIIPLVNCVLLLLLFLVVNSRTVAQSGARVELPTLLTSSMLTFAHRELIITDDNTIYWDNVKFTKEQLKSLFTKVAARKEAILIKADTHVGLGTLVEIWDSARQEGVAQVYIATN